MNISFLFKIKIKTLQDLRTLLTSVNFINTVMMGSRVKSTRCSYRGHSLILSTSTVDGNDSLLHVEV